MSEVINLANKIEQSLPEELAVLIRKSATIAGGKNLQLYLVGGVVRDLMLRQSNFDLDLVVEGDAIALAKEFTEKVGGKLTVHTMFNTAKLSLGKWSIDIAMARTETYAKPGALPAVKPGTIKTDLFRRDFTINAMAVCLSTENYGELIDLYGGLNDLNNKLLRILHEKSFIDDATRIWRAIRYEQRLGFQIEPETLKLLKRDVPILKTVGGYRLRRELELVLAEKEPEQILLRADKLGVLKELHPSLKADDWLVEKFKEARESKLASQELYLSIMTARLTDSEFAEFVSYLRFTKQVVDRMREKRPD
jgi:tRNA nucleotidyltransferase (CCA-adding enzyme)